MENIIIGFCVVLLVVFALSLGFIFTHPYTFAAAVAIIFTIASPEFRIKFYLWTQSLDDGDDDDED